jgi:hypothetical protein
VRSEKDHVAPEVKMVNEIVCDQVWHTCTPNSATRLRWCIRTPPLFSGLSLWMWICWVAAQLLNKLASWKLWCPVSLSELSCNTVTFIPVLWFTDTDFLRVLEIVNSPGAVAQ